MTSISSYAVRPHPMQSDPAWSHARFERAVDIVQSLPRSGPIQTNYDDKLLLYSVYKQATEGDIATSRPGLLDVLGRAKWDAWNKRKGLAFESAERMYVDALLKILRSFADRTQAQALIQELENFTLHARGSALGSTITGSGSESSGSSSSSTEDDRRPTKAPAPSHRHRQPPPPASTGRRAPPPPHIAGSGSLAPPSLPGYGPPRTQPDTPRRAGKRPVRGHAPEEVWSESEEESDTEEERRVRENEYLARSSFAARHAPHARKGQFAGYPAAPLSPGAHSFKSALSPAPSIAQQSGMQQAVRLAYPPNAPGPQQIASGSGLLPPIETARVVGAVAANVGEANPALAMALDKIQTSLTALHERMNTVERTTLLPQATSTTSNLDNPSSLPALLQLLLLRTLAALNVRQLSSHEARAPRSAALLARLLGWILAKARKLAGDAVVLLVVVGVLARLTGRRDAMGELVLRSVWRMVGPKAGPPSRVQ